MLYTIVLSLHNILRWVILIVALLTIIRSLNGLRFKRGFTEADNKVSMWFASLMDIQLLLGLLLYFVLSPVTTAAMQNFGAAMGQSAIRFFLIEHSVAMFLAVIAVHVGRSLVKRVDKTMKPASPGQPTAAERIAVGVAKHRRNITWTLISLAIVLISIPWPFYPAARPLLRFFGL